MSYLAMPSILDISSSATIAASASPAVLVLPDVNQQINCNYDAMTGIVTVLQSATYTFEFQFLASSVLGGRLNFYAEADTGSGFVAVPRSARTDSVQILSNKLIAFGATRYFQQGTRLRSYVFGSGFTLGANTPAGSPVECPAARIMMSN
jgi:hypothetical protein